MSTVDSHKLARSSLSCSCNHSRQELSDVAPMPEKSETICDRLKQARREAGFLSVKVAAEAPGFPIPKDTLIGWESRGNEPGVVRLAEVCEFYGVSVAWMIGDSNHPSGLPVAEAVVDMDAVHRVDQAETFEEIRDLTTPCRWCTKPRLPIAFEFPGNHAVKTAMEIVNISERVNGKLDNLLSKEQ